MIRVIKDNQPKPQTTCVHCLSILEYSKEDIQWGYIHGGNCLDLFIICTVCHRKTKVRIKSLT